VNADLKNEILKKKIDFRGSKRIAGKNKKSRL
jgi:hypothetical protein